MARWREVFCEHLVRLSSGATEPIFRRIDRVEMPNM